MVDARVARAKNLLEVAMHATSTRRVQRGHASSTVCTQVARNAHTRDAAAG